MRARRGSPDRGVSATAEPYWQRCHTRELSSTVAHCPGRGGELMSTGWDRWLSGAWPELISGTQVEVPASLPPPEWWGMRRVDDQWVRGLGQGRTLIVSHAGPDGSRFVAELRTPRRRDEALRKAKEWACEHPVAAAVIGGVIFVAFVALVAGLMRSNGSQPAQKKPDFVPDGGDDQPTSPSIASAPHAAPDVARQAVSASFAELLACIQPSDAELAKAESHAKSVEAALRDAFSVNKLLTVGSHFRRTAVRASSDVDYFAVVARDDVRWGDEYTSSETVLKNVRTTLQEKFKKTGIRKDLQAVVVRYDDGEDPVDVVPAVFLGMTSNGRPRYRMPDGKGGWLETSPEGHSKYICEADTRSGRKLRGTAQLLKYWRDCRSSAVPLQSFHLELLLATSGVCRVGMSFAECMVAALERLHVTQCQPVVDPLGISGHVAACSTEAKRTAAFAAVESALVVATDAVAAERAGDLPAARGAWSRFFNGAFPG